MGTHKRQHVHNGDIKSDTEFVPHKVEEWCVHSDHALYSSILQHDSLAHFQENDDRDSPEELSDDDCLNAIISGSEGFDTFLSLEEDEDTISNVTEEMTRVKVLEMNTSLWNSHKHYKVSHDSLGLNCIGPKSGGRGSMGYEDCPHGVVLEFDNARLWLDTKYSCMRLNYRCVTCRATVKLDWILARHNTSLDSGEDFCRVQGCNQPSFRASGECSKHLSSRMMREHCLETAQDLSGEKMKSLRECLQSAAQKKWTFPQYYDIVRRGTSEIEQGKRPGSDLVILDDEFSPASKQLWEFAIIERNSGKVLFDTHVAHEDGLDHESMTRNPFLTRMSQLKAAKVNSSVGLAQIERLRADEVALRFQKAGITQDTIILIWHVNKFDLTLLRSFLESAGHSGILPPDENCIPMVHLFRMNLRVGPPGYSFFPLSLEIIFPTLYPRHGLIGLNHRALEDTQQTRLVCMAFDELCKPLSQRSPEWQPDTVVNTAQKSLLGWAQEEPPAEKAEKSRKRSAPRQEDETVKPKRKRV